MTNNQQLKTDNYSEADLFDQDGWYLTDEEREVWRHIRTRRGRENAIDIRTLAFQTRLTKKRVQVVVSHLVREHGKLIGSAYSDPPGLFVITDKDELEKECKQLRSRAMKCLVRASRLQKTSLEEVFGQARLEFKDVET